MYSADGYVSSNIPSDNRLNIASGEFKSATLEELQSAARYISYCGRYEVKEDYVLHHMEVSFFPNWVGKTIKRNFEFKDNKLILTADEMTRNIGQQSSAVIVWEKVEALNAINYQ